MKKIYLIKMQSRSDPYIFHSEYVVEENLANARKLVQDKYPHAEYRCVEVADFFMKDQQEHPCGFYST
jgi:hypothetical protein